MLKQLFIICLLLLGKLAFASSIGTLNGGLVAGGGADDTGFRERIELFRSGGLLIGQPKHSSIELVTIHASELTNSHLILREVQQSTNKRSLLFTAPDSLMEKISRATIYLKRNEKDFIFLETVEGKWVEREPQPFTSELKIRNSLVENNLYAVSVNGLGPFWLLEDTTSKINEPLKQNNGQSARLLLGGKLEIALQPLTIAVLFLVFWWGISLIVHRLDRHASR